MTDFTMANMAIEAGGKNGIFPVDELTEQLSIERNMPRRPWKVYEADEDAEYDEEYDNRANCIKTDQYHFPHLTGKYKNN